MVAHKFGYLNALHGADLNRALAAKKDDQPFSASSRGKLFKSMMEERSEKRRPAALKDRLRAELQGEFFGKFAQSLMIDSIRYCPICLESWFHASIFQLDALARCPQHGCSLQTGCQRCGCCWSVDFRNDDYLSPLHCPRCKAPFAGVPPAYDQVFSAVPRGYGRLIRLSAQVRLACRKAGTIWTVRGSWNELRNPGIDLFLSLWRAEGQANCSAFHSDNPDTGLISEAVPENINVESFEALACLVRSIGRHFEKKVFNTCGHRGRIKFTLRSSSQSAGPVVSIECLDKACACCYVLAKWRLQFAQVFSVVAIARGFPPKLPAHGKVLRQAARWTASEIYHSFGLIAKQVQTCLGVVDELRPILDNYRHPSARNVGDLQLPGIGAVPRIVPYLENSTTSVHKFYVQAEVQKSLDRLALVAVLPLKRVDGRDVGTFEKDLWGKVAGDWTVSFGSTVGFWNEESSEDPKPYYSRMVMTLCAMRDSSTFAGGVWSDATL